MKNFLDNQTSQTIQKTGFSIVRKRVSVFDERKIDEEHYRNQMRALRAKTFENFEQKLDQAVENLQNNGFIVHQVKDAAEANLVIENLIKEAKFIVKAKSNTAREIDLENQALAKHAWTQTDLGDFINQLFTSVDMHYVLPALHITPEAIAQKIKEVYADVVAAEAEALTHYLCAKIREHLLKADLGITGANFFTQTGQVVLLENEGNISLVSRLPAKHIVIAGIDKLVESVENAITLCQTAAIYGTGQKITQYISVISGPSKTADIQNQLVLGAQGAQEVHIILLDNGRTNLLKEGWQEMLFCINCGSCLNTCPVYHQRGSRYGGTYLGSKGIINSAFCYSLDKAKEVGAFDCTLCGNCQQNCPMKIDLPKMVRIVREKLETAGLQEGTNKDMLKNIQQYGNPFGENIKETPDKLYCC